MTGRGTSGGTGGGRSLKTAAEGPLKPVVLDLFESNCR